MTKLGILKYSAFGLTLAGTAAVLWSLKSGKKLNRASRLFLAGVAAAGLLVFYALKIEPNWIEITHVTVHDRALAGALKGVRIVQITDLHLTEGIQSREKDLVRKVNRLKPDLILMSGDYFDDLSQLKYAVEVVRGLKARIGVWGVPGNTDYISMDGVSLAREFAGAGARILVNQAERIETGAGRFFWLAGADEPVYGHADLERTLAGVPAGEPCLLLAHSPDIFEAAAARGVNLTLAGHTHGGQIGIPLLVRLSNYANRTPYMRGLYKKGNSRIYVNRGIGMKTLYFRFLCRPEIAVIEVKP